ncbi:unnamed protein product [Closterium sp. Naga37s-1]|nr:unnamed protein product [Closterium sp. Naga37s-1]
MPLSHVLLTRTPSSLLPLPFPSARGARGQRGGAARGLLCLIPPFHSLEVYSWGEEGDGAARAHQEASLWLTPPFHSLQHGGQRGDDTAGGTDGGEVLLHRCSGVYSWGEEGDGAARAHQEASLWLTPPFHSLQHGGQRGDDTAGGTDGGEVLLHRCSGVYSWGEEGDGAARAHQEASLWLTPPFHSLQHGGQRGDDTAGGTDGGEVLLHRCSGVYSWGEEGDGAARAHQEASLWLTPPFHSLQHGGQRGDDTAGGTDGGEVLLHRCSGVYSWGEEGDGAARAHQEASLWLTPPFHSLQHGGQRGDDTAGGTADGTRTEDPKTAPDCGIGVVRQGWLTALGRTRPAPEAPLCVSECSDEGWGDAP